MATKLPLSSVEGIVGELKSYIDKKTASAAHIEIVSDIKAMADDIENGNFDPSTLYAVTLKRDDLC